MVSSPAVQLNVNPVCVVGSVVTQPCSRMTGVQMPVLVVATQSGCLAVSGWWGSRRDEGITALTETRQTLRTYDVLIESDSGKARGPAKCSENFREVLSATLLAPTSAQAMKAGLQALRYITSGETWAHVPVGWPGGLFDMQGNALLGHARSGE